MPKRISHRTKHLRPQEPKAIKTSKTSNEPSFSREDEKGGRGCFLLLGWVMGAILRSMYLFHPFPQLLATARLISILSFLPFSLLPNK